MGINFKKGMNHEEHADLEEIRRY